MSDVSHAGAEGKAAPADGPSPGPDSVAPEWLCPTCGTANPPSFLYCRSCGRLLPRTGDAGSATLRPPPASPAQHLRDELLPLSVELIQAGRATQFDSAAIRQALAIVQSTTGRLQTLTEQFAPGSPEEFVWERNPGMAESSSLIEGAGGLLAMAAAPDTPDPLRRLFLRRAFWVLRVADGRTRALLEEGER
jgi:hypothetical protein